jgi:hypothetical protein
MKNTARRGKPAGFACWATIGTPEREPNDDRSVFGVSSRFVRDSMRENGIVVSLVTV